MGHSILWRKANGADSKLSTPLSPTRGLLVRRTDKKRLASDVSPTKRVGRFFTGARTGIRFHLPAVSALRDRDPSMPHQHSGGTVTDHPLMVPDFAHPGPAEAFFCLQSVTGCPALTADQRSRSPQSTELASGRNLLHALSQRPRGQYPPYRMFKKFPINSVR